MSILLIPVLNHLVFLEVVGSIPTEVKRFFTHLDFFLCLVCVA